MNTFDFSSPAVLHLGNGSKPAMVALGIALGSAFAPVQSAQDRPLVHVAPQQTNADIKAQLASTPMVAASSEQDFASKWSNYEKEYQLATEKAKIQDIRQDFAANAEAIAREKGTGSCFGGFLNGERHQSEIEKSTVMLVPKNSNGQTMAVGSGFVVRDSAGSDGHNRIVTARHMVNGADLEAFSRDLPVYIDALRGSAVTVFPGLSMEMSVKNYLRYTVKAQGDIDRLSKDMTTPFSELTFKQKRRLDELFGLPHFDHIDAYASNGAFLGCMDKIAMAHPDGLRTNVDTERSVVEADDWAVLTLNTQKTTDDAIRQFDAIPGLPIAPVQAKSKTWGMSGDGYRPAVTQGYSGGPVVDDEGVHGITSAAAKLPDTVAKINGMMDPFGVTRQSGMDNMRSAVDLPDKAILVVNPLGDPNLLGALGNAGRGVTVSENAPLVSSSRAMTFAGMPQGVCGASATIQVPYGAPLPDVPASAYKGDVATSNALLSSASTAAFARFMDNGGTELNLSTYR